MKKIYFSFLLVLFTVSVSIAQDDELFKLYKSKQFTALNQNNNPKHSLYHFYKAVYENVCNRPAASNKHLDAFMKGKKQPLESIAFEYWRLRGDNYIKLFDYKNASTVQQMLMTSYSNRYDSAQLKGEKHAVKIWQSLQKEKPQTTQQPARAIVPLTRDLAGLINIRT